MSEIKLSNQQKEILKQFRSNLEELLTPHHTDAELLKWLRAKNFDLKKAERNFRQVDLHRKMLCVDKILETYENPKVVQKYARTWFLGFAKDGAVVRYSLFDLDFHGFVQSVSQFDMSLYFINLFEGDLKLTREENMKTGKELSDIIFVLDVDNYSFSDLSYKCVIETALEYICLLQDYYPEIWRYILFVNVPYLFYKLAFLFKHIMRDTILEKIKIASKSNSLDLLREYMDDDIIPSRLGGKRQDFHVDPSSRIINPAGKITEEFYLKNLMHFIDETDPGVKMVTIRPKGCYNVPLIFREAGSKMRIEFRTENGNLHFLILYRPFGLDPENPDLPASDEYLDGEDERANVLAAGSRVRFQSHITPNDGTFVAVWPGIYILQFDNTSSWFASRKLYYRVTVTPPDS